MRGVASTPIKCGARSDIVSLRDCHTAKIRVGPTIPELGQSATVPRYYFHFSDGKRQFTDSTGQDLVGIAAARLHAAQQVREIKAAMCYPQIQDLSAWSLQAVDAHGRTVCEIGFDLRPVRVAHDL